MELAKSMAQAHLEVVLLQGRVWLGRSAVPHLSLLSIWSAVITIITNSRNSDHSIRTFKFLQTREALRIKGQAPQTKCQVSRAIRSLLLEICGISLDSVFVVVFF